MRTAPMVLVLLPLLGDAATAGAAPPDACARAYERAQEHRLEGHLRSAREALVTCARTSCPAFIHNDCTKWLDEVEAAQPSVVFAVRLDGRDLDQVEVTCNEQRLATRLDGRPLAIDPGKQRCQFQATEAQPASAELVIAQGQKDRIVEVTLVPRAAPPKPSPTPAPAPEVASDWRARLRLSPPVVLAGVSAVGLIGFVAFGASGLAAEHEVQDVCAPDCTPEDLSTVNFRYHMANASLAVGALAAVGAGYLYWREHTSTPRLSLVVHPAGASLTVAGSF